MNFQVMGPSQFGNNFQSGGPCGMGSNPIMQMMQMMMTMMMAIMNQMSGGQFGNPMGMGGMSPGMNPGFGGAPGFGSPCGCGTGVPGASNFLGGSSGPAGATSGPGVTVDPGSIQGAGWGADLARFAASNANGPGGWCYKWVGQALRKFGVNVHGASAYMAADQLANNPKFREVQVSPKDLPRLPAGAVVVWNKGNGHQHGHISIALGNGKEASDKLRNQITNYGTSVRVFIPK